MAAERYIGLDIHKRHVLVAAVDSQQQIVLTPQKVALEATTNSWEFYDQLAPTVAEVAVANCFQLRLISTSGRKTNRHDAL